MVAAVVAAVSAITAHRHAHRCGVPRHDREQGQQTVRNATSRFQFILRRCAAATGGCDVHTAIDVHHAVAAHHLRLGGSAVSWRSPVHGVCHQLTTWALEHRRGGNDNTAAPRAHDVHRARGVAPSTTCATSRAVTGTSPARSGRPGAVYLCSCKLATGQATSTTTGAWAASYGARGAHHGEQLHKARQQ